MHGSHAKKKTTNKTNPICTAVIPAILCRAYMSL